MHPFLLSIRGMRCGACAAKVQGALSSLESIQTIEVDHQRDCAIVSAAVAPSEHEVRLVLSQAGGFTLEEMKAETNPSDPIAGVQLTTGESDASAVEVPSQSLFPLFLIVGYIFAITLLVAWSNSQWSVDSMMSHFMAGFFLVFSFFKFLDAPGFASAFKMYDPLAKAVPGWSWVYPYVELLLGVAYMMSWQPLATNVTTLVLMSVGGVGVLQSLLQKRTIRCACLGTALNLPMTKVTLVENGTMAAMAAFMLAGCASPMSNAALASLGIEGATSLRVSVLALDGDTYPDMPDMPDMPNVGASIQENLMHGWTILQACSLDQGRPSIQVLRALNSDIAQGHGGVPVDCFQPRHAVRIQSEDAVKEYLICFQCHNFQYWVDGSLVASGSISNKSEEILNRALAHCSQAVPKAS